MYKLQTIAAAIKVAVTSEDLYLKIYYFKIRKDL